MAPQRFLTLNEVAEVLNTSTAQVYALVRRDELKAMKLGGRGQWRVQASDLEDFITDAFDKTKRYVDEHPFDEALESETAEQ